MYMGMTLRLRFRDGHPVFVRYGLEFGHTLLLTWGIYDLDRPRVCYSYILRLSPDGCSVQRFELARYDKYCPDQLLMPGPEPRVLEMAQRINQAVAKGDALDLSAYYRDQRDRHFRIWLLDDSAGREIPPPDFQKTPIPNDYSVDFWEAPANVHVLHPDLRLRNLRVVGDPRAVRRL